MSKYEALGEFLKRQSNQRVTMSFAEIERIIGAKLPPSARKHRPWWSNNPTNSAMTQIWLAAGYESEQVDMAARRLVFRRVRSVEGPGAGLAEPSNASAYDIASYEEAARRDVPAKATSLTSREFDQDAEAARKSAAQGPVFITDHGRAAHVLLTIEDYQRLRSAQTSLAEALAQPGTDFDFDPPRIGNGIFKPADLG
jgi:PHD/YefM family antitoxin component YafN of YafNO toxin-antitoxin module